METDSQPRNDAGQYTSAEPQYGLAGVEADQGYISIPDKPAASTSSDDDEPWATSSSDEAIRALADKKFGPSQTDPVVITTVDEFGDPVPDNVAMSVERAASDYSALHAGNDAAIEAQEIAQLAADVDQLRLEKVRFDPSIAAHYGLDLGDIATKAEESKAKLAEASPEAKLDKVAIDKAGDIAAEGKQSATTDVDGLAPEVAQALKHPQVREAVEQEFAKADTARAQYENAVSVANSFAQQALSDQLPELQGLAPEMWEAALSVLYQQDPGRVSGALNVLSRYAQTSQATAQLQQQRATEQQQAVETWAKSQDARLADFGVELNAEVVNDVVDYSTKELGIGREQLGRILLANPILRSAEFTRVMADAAKYRSLKQAPGKALPKAIPAVLKPGIASSKVERAAAGVGNLQAKLNSSGSIDDAWALYQARGKR